MNKHIILGIAAILILVATTYIPAYVKDDKSLKNVSFGYPISFITQDYSDYIGRINTPVKVKFSTTRLQTRPEKSNINQTLFIVNLLVFFGLLELIFYYSENFYGKNS